MPRALVASIDLERDLDAAKEVTGGAGAPSVIGHTYMSHCRDPHSEERDHPASTYGPFEQQ
jgi:hypothetical protein